MTAEIKKVVGILPAASTLAANCGPFRRGDYSPVFVSSGTILSTRTSVARRLSAFSTVT